MKQHDLDITKLPLLKLKIGLHYKDIKMIKIAIKSIIESKNKDQNL